MKVSIYRRLKNREGRWRYERVNTGRGRRPANLSGPFYLRYTSPEGKQPFVPGGDTLSEAIETAERLGHALEARARGLTVQEFDLSADPHRVTIRAAVQSFLEAKKSKAKRTLDSYVLHLNEFLAALPVSVRFVDEINEHVLRKYKDRMAAQGLSARTMHNRLLTIRIFLKKQGFKIPLAWDEMPTFEEEPAVPYEAEQLKRLFAAMDEEQAARYKFFLGSACRDKEVTFAAWQDIDFSKGTYQIRSKPDVGFTIKNHESRTVPLPKPLVELLKHRHKKAPHARWIFVNEEGRPDNHFLRKLKRIAFHAGLNCGQCVTTVTKGRYEGKRPVEVSCKTDPVCAHWYLHRFRKTCATRWQENGIPIRTIQHWLGHKSLETTMKYLGVTDTEKLRGQIDQAFCD